MEVLSVKVTINSLNFVICLTYKPPNYTEQYDTLVLSYLRSFDDSTDLLIVEDLNLPDVYWNTYSGCTTISNTYAEMIFDLNLMQLIDSPTHTTGYILDVILTNTDYCRNNVTHPTLPPGFSSDHHIITFSITHYSNRPSELPKYKYDFHYASWGDMNQYLYSYNFSHIFNSRDIKFIWEQLKLAIFNTTNMFVPKVSTRNAN